MRMSDEEWFDVINTNLQRRVPASKACLRGMMKQRWGRMVNIASVVGAMGNAGQTNYSATKAGVMGLPAHLWQRNRLAQHHGECGLPRFYWRRI